MDKHLESRVQKDVNYFIFVTLPTSETVRLRNLYRQVSVAEIRDRLEIKAGLPCQLYWIALPGEKVLEDNGKITFGRELRNGAILKTGLHSQWGKLYQTVRGNNCDADTVYNLVVGNAINDDGNADDRTDAKDAANDISNSERSLVILYLASFFGYVQICKTVLSLDPEVQFRMTSFGRTAVHVASASDQVGVVQLLLARNAELSPRDALGKTPLNYAKDYGAYTCERLLRFKVLTINRNRRPPVHTENVPPIRKFSLNNSEDSEPSPKSTDQYPAKTCTSDLSIGASEGTVSPEVVPAPKRESPRLNRVRWASVRDLSKVSEKPTRNRSGPDNPSNDPKKTKGTCHKSCKKRPSFVAVRRIPLEDQKLVTVEFTPLERPPLTDDRDNEPKSPQTRSIDKHLWAEKVARYKVESVGKRVENSRRTQSAQYYRTKYHPSHEEEVYRARPSTAGPRFRFWKTWLLEKMQEDAVKEEMAKHDDQRRRCNMVAYRRWLSRKQRVVDKHATSEESDGSDEGESPYNNWPSPREQAFSKWLESKRTALLQMTRKKREAERKAKDAENITRKKDVYDRRITCFEIGCTDQSPMKPPTADRYITAYKTWLVQKRRYEDWKSSHKDQLPESNDKELTVEDIEEARYALLMDGMSYEEWLGMKQREAKLQRQINGGSKG